MNLMTISKTGKEEYSLAEIQKEINSNLEYLQEKQTTPYEDQCINQINLCVHELLNTISDLTKQTV
jgi:hypothetical protein